MNIYEESVELHKKIGGKLSISSKVRIKNKHDLSLAYTPGVAQVCREIAEDKSKSFDLTMRKNAVAVVSDGSAVLGLGNIGAEAAIPVMEGKAVLFKEFAGIDAIPLCINTQDTEEIISFVRHIAPTFAGINLEDISAPRCFEIEERLQDLGIPVFHDDQHGTAIVLLAALLNAVKLAQKKLEDLKIVINGSGAAGIAIAKLLHCIGHEEGICVPVKEIIMCDSKGIISQNREDIKDNKAKVAIASHTNFENIDGKLEDAIKDCDIFIGVSQGNLLNKQMIKSMNDKPIIFAMANPIPEVMPDDAKTWGAFIIGTGRSDFANQINNVLAFPGIFRGAIDAKSPRITEEMKIAAAHAIANCVKDLSVDNIIPSPLDKEVAVKVADAVKETK